MPQSLGQFTVASGTPIQLVPGNHWKYIRIINKSPYLLSVDMSGMGKFDFPEMYLEDIPIHRSFTGQINILPRTDLTNTAFSPTYTLLVMGWSTDENVTPQSQPLTFLSNVGNTVNVSTVQTLSNEGNASKVVQVIDVGDSIFANLFLLFTGGSGNWNVDQAGTKHTAITINASGNPLQLGQTGDVTETLGQHTIDQAANFGGQLKPSGAGTVLNFADSGGTTRHIFSFVSPNFPITAGGIVGVTGVHTSIAGSTSGNVDIWELMSGASWKYLIVYWSSTYNSTTKNYTLINPFTAKNHAIRGYGNIGGNSFLASSVAQTVSLTTGFGAGGARTTTNVTVTPSGSGFEGWIQSAWDTLSFIGGGSVGAASLFIEGQ